MVRGRGGAWFLAPALLCLLLQAVHARLDRAPDFDEASYMAFARNILRTGTLDSPAFPGRPFTSHPPLFYGLVALSFALFGPGLEAGRIVSTVTSVLVLGLMFMILRRERGDGWAAAGTLLVAVNPAFLYYAHSVYMEMTVALWMTAAIWAFRRAQGSEKSIRGYAVTGTLLGLACLTKYYAGVLVVVLAVLIGRDRGPALTRRSRLAALLLPVVLAAVAWAAFGLWVDGGRFLTANLGWLTPTSLRAEYSWRNVSNLLFVRELIGVLTPVFSLLAIAAVIKAVRKRADGPTGASWTVWWVFSAAYLLFLLAFHEKDVKYVVPIIPTLGILVTLATPREWRTRMSPPFRWGAVLLTAAIASPLVPLYDPLSGRRHDNLWVFGIRRDAEYRQLAEVGRFVGGHSSPESVLACEQKCPIVGYYADRAFIDLWGRAPDRILAQLADADIVVLDEKVEYLTRAEQDAVRIGMARDWVEVSGMPPVLASRFEVYRRRGG